jgi:hypothetical protein
MYLPGDRDAHRYAALAANYSAVVDFTNLAFLMEQAPMELETSLAPETILREFFIRMAAWANVNAWSTGTLSGIPLAQSNVGARFVSPAVSPGSGIWRTPLGAVGSHPRFRVHRGAEDFRSTANLQPFVAGLGISNAAAGTVLRELSWNSKQIRRKHMRNTSVPLPIIGTMDDVFRITLRFKDILGKPVLDVNLPNYRSSYMRGVAYNRSVWHAREHITPIFRTCE